MSNETLKHCTCGCIYLESDCPNCNKVTDATRIEELEAKLAKAVEAFEGLLAILPDDEDPEIDYARTTIAALKGDKT